MPGILLIILLSTLGVLADDTDSTILKGIIEKMPPPLVSAARDPKHEVQILYVRVDRNQNGPTFTPHTWKLDDTKYFYPASTVKLPVALLALEKLNALNVPGLNRDTTMLTLSGRPWQTERHADPTARSGKPSIGQDLRKIFLVSDNDSYNRLFEFIGSQKIHNRCDALGRNGTHIFHRLSVGRGKDHGRFGNPIRFIGKDGGVIFEQAESIAPREYGHGKTIQKGNGFIKGGTLIGKPMDFSKLNSFTLADQHWFLRDLFFPSKAGLKLAKEDRNDLCEIMGQYPRENKEIADQRISGMPDLYVKNFLRWLKPPVRNSLQCYNKSGRAYGYLTDNAYIVDREHGIEFFLAATIHVNANGIFNDNIYEYDTIGEPFMSALGKGIYNFERTRVR